MDKQNKFCFTIGVLYDFTRLFLAKLLFLAIIEVVILCQNLTILKRL